MKACQSRNIYYSRLRNVYSEAEGFVLVSAPFINEEPGVIDTRI